MPNQLPGLVLCTCAEGVPVSRSFGQLVGHLVTHLLFGHSFGHSVSQSVSRHSSSSVHHGTGILNAALDWIQLVGLYKCARAHAISCDFSSYLSVTCLRMNIRTVKLDNLPPMQQTLDI